MLYAIINTSTIVNKTCILLMLELWWIMTVFLEAGGYLVPGAIVKGEDRVLACSKID